MHIIARSPLEKFWQRHRDAEQSLKAWYRDVQQADWKTPIDVKDVYRAADILPDNRVVFNIKGNRYRLVVRIRYSSGVVYIRFVGTRTQNMTE